MSFWLVTLFFIKIVSMGFRLTNTIYYRTKTISIGVLFCLWYTKINILLNLKVVKNIIIIQVKE